MMIHKEGYRILLITFLTLVALNILILVVLSPDQPGKIIALSCSLLLFLFVLYFFRQPNREIEPNDKLVYAPADGRVVVIEEMEETEYFNDRRVQISIFMSPLNIHINHYSMSGMVKYLNYTPGKNLVAYHPKSSTLNERSTLVIDNGKGYKVMIRQIAGMMARRIVCYAKLNESVNQGDQLGFIKFGSRVDLFLPLNSKIKVNLDQLVKGNRTIIAEI